MDSDQRSPGDVSHLPSGWKRLDHNNQAMRRINDVNYEEDRFVLNLMKEMAEALEACIETSRYECTHADAIDDTGAPEVLKKFKEWK